MPDHEGRHVTCGVKSGHIRLLGNSAVQPDVKAIKSRSDNVASRVTSRDL